MPLETPTAQHFNGAIKMQAVQLYQISLNDFLDEMQSRIQAGIKAAMEGEKQEQQGKPYLTREEVCQMLSISLTTLHKRIKKNQLNPVRFQDSSRILFRRSEIEAVLNTQNTI